MRSRWILTGVAVVALATGCGDDGAPADAVPALSLQLDRVDAAIDSGRFGAARSALADLVAETEQARADGTLDAEHAEAILEAAGTLDGELPAAPPSSTPSTSSAEPDDEETEEPPPATKPPKAHPKTPKKPKHHSKPHKKPHKKPGHGHGR